MALTPKEKLDSVLGISDGQSIDDYLDGLTAESENLQKTTENIDNAVKSTVNEIDQQITALQKSNGPVNPLAIAELEKNFAEISDLIQTSKSIIAHLYENVVNTSLIDPEVINATATFIEVAHSNIKEYIDLYKDRLKFFDKIRFEMLAQQNKKELLEMKHKFAMEKLQQSQKASAENGVGMAPAGMYMYKQEDALEILASIDAENSPVTSYFDEPENILPPVQQNPAQEETTANEKES